ncbi:MAG: serine O-acetyltransferase [Sulfuricaulis sp.]
MKRIKIADTVREVWRKIKKEAEAQATDEPVLAAYLHDYVLRHIRYEHALYYSIALSLSHSSANVSSLFELAMSVVDDKIVQDSIDDLKAYYTRDPACKNFISPLLYYKGFKAVQAHRIAHVLWKSGREGVARFLQARVAEVFAMDIHPGASLGRGIFIDHGTGIVVGETSVVEDNVSMLHSVTLGGTGKETKDRHPKIREGVLIGAGAKILGNIEVGKGAKVAAGSVVLSDVPAHSTVAGVPAKVVGVPGKGIPALDMVQEFDRTGKTLGV